MSRTTFSNMQSLTSPYPQFYLLSTTQQQLQYQRNPHEVHDGLIGEDWTSRKPQDNRCDFSFANSPDQFTSHYTFADGTQIEELSGLSAPTMSGIPAMFIVRHHEMDGTIRFLHRYSKHRTDSTALPQDDFRYRLSAQSQSKSHPGSMYPANRPQMSQQRQVFAQTPPMQDHVANAMGTASVGQGFYTLSQQISIAQHQVQLLQRAAILKQNHLAILQEHNRRIVLQGQSWQRQAPYMNQQRQASQLQNAQAYGSVPQFNAPSQQRPQQVMSNPHPSQPRVEIPLSANTQPPRSSIQSIILRRNAAKNRPPPAKAGSSQENSPRNEDQKAIKIQDPSVTSHTQSTQGITIPKNAIRGNVQLMSKLSNPFRNPTPQTETSTVLGQTSSTQTQSQSSTIPVSVTQPKIPTFRRKRKAVDVQAGNDKAKKKTKQPDPAPDKPKAKRGRKPKVPKGVPVSTPLNAVTASDQAQTIADSQVTPSIETGLTTGSNTSTATGSSIQDLSSVQNQQPIYAHNSMQSAYAEASPATAPPISVLPAVQQIDNQPVYPQMDVDVEDLLNTIDFQDETSAVIDHADLQFYNDLSQASVTSPLPFIGHSFDDEFENMVTDGMTDFDTMMATTLHLTNESLLDPNPPVSYSDDFRVNTDSATAKNSLEVPVYEDSAVIGQDSVQNINGEAAENQQGQVGVDWSMEDGIPFGNEFMGDFSMFATDEAEYYWPSDDTELFGQEMDMGMEQEDSVVAAAVPNPSAADAENNNFESMCWTSEDTELFGHEIVTGTGE